MKCTSGMSKMFIGSLVLLLVVGFELREALADERPTNPEVGRNTFELLSYQDSGYRFMIIGPNEEPPSGFEQPGFDETGFDIGNASFGGGGGGAIGGGDCPLRATVQTPWLLESQLLVRRVVSIPAGATNVRVMVSVDNDILGVFFNGTRIAGFISHGECPIRDEFRFDVPQELVQPGENLVAFHVLDRGDTAPANESFFDTRILADITSREQMAVLSNIADLVESRLPLVPVSTIAFNCPVPTLFPEGDIRTTITFLVDSTGEEGKISIQHTPTATTVATKFFLDGGLMADTVVTPSRQRITTTRELRKRLDELDPAAISLDTVFARPEVPGGIIECIQPTINAATCEEKCAKAIEITATTIQAGAQISTRSLNLIAVLANEAASIAASDETLKQATINKCIEKFCRPNPQPPTVTDR